MFLLNPRSSLGYSRTRFDKVRLVRKNTNRARKNKLIDLNDRRQTNSLRYLPRLPQLSSDGKGWNEIDLEYHCQPPCETPEHCALKHAIEINYCNEPITIEQTLNGRFQRHHLVGGEIMIRPARSSYQVRWDRENNFIILFLEPSLIYRTADEINLNNFEISSHFVRNDPLLYQIGLTLKSELELSRKYSQLFVESVAKFLAVHLLRHYFVENQKVRQYSYSLSQERLQQVTDYINDCLEKDLSLVELASAIHMSTHHFSKLFKQSTGLSPYQYVTYQRVMRARELLAMNEYTIVEIAIMVGFSNQSNLNRHFKRLIGVTPGIFRKKSQERTKKP
jgi:AraC family transcriptional regulator